MTFHVGDQIAHPMHGAGTIVNIVTKRINGIDREYYELQLPVGNMRVMVPVESSNEIGIRPIISPEKAEQIWKALPGLQVTMTQNWNRRYRENMLRIKSGDLLEVAKVIKGLISRNHLRGLSTEERKMLHSAKQILISELVLSQHSSFEETEARLNSVFE